MEKYILQILENNSRVILPEFGAFIIKQKNPLIIVFNEFLQYNDGVMVDTIAKNEGIDRDAAKKKIDAFIKEINSRLEKGTPFVIEHLGALVKSSNGKISLEKESLGKTGKEADTKKTENKPSQAKKVSEEPDKTAEKEKKETIAKAAATEEKKQVKEVPVEKKEKPEEKIKEEAEIPKKPAKEEKQEEKQQPVAKAPVPPAQSVSQKKQENSESTTKPSDKNTPVSKTSATEVKTSGTKRTGTYTARTTVPPKDTKKKTNIWLWVILILIVNGIIISYFIMSDQLSGLFKKSDDVSIPEVQDMTNSSEEESSDDVLIIEPIEQIIEEEPVVPAASSKPAPAVSGKRYYIVAGVFREEKNADNLVLELRNKGYNAEKFGKIGSLHAVSFGMYNSKADAHKEMNRIKQEENPEAWIKVVN